MNLSRQREREKGNRNYSCSEAWLILSNTKSFVSASLLVNKRVAHHLEPLRVKGWTKQIFKSWASLETARTESSIPWTAATLGNSLPALLVEWTHVCNPCYENKTKQNVVIQMSVSESNWTGFTWHSLLERSRTCALSLLLPMLRWTVSPIQSSLCALRMTNFE